MAGVVSIRLRILALVVLAVTGATAATAWLTLRQATHQITASAEAHLTTCADCRARLTPQLDTGRLDAIWHGVDDRVQLASLPWFERTLVRVGVGEDTARLLAALGLTLTLTGAGVNCVRATAL